MKVQALPDPFRDTAFHGVPSVPVRNSAVRRFVMT